MLKKNGPQRILHIVTIMNRAGLETMLMNYYRKIDRNKIQFDFLVHRSEEGDYDDEIKSLGGKIYYAPAINLKNIFLYNKIVKDFFTNHKEYKIVHSHIDALSCFPLKAAKSAGIPIRIAHSHNNNFNKDAKYFFRLICKKRIKFYATDYFGCSKEAINFMFGNNIINPTVLKNAIDSDKYSFNEKSRDNIREKLGINGKFVIGHIGRFSYQKNHEFLIDVFSEILKLHSNSTLLLIGSGEEEEKIKLKVKNLNLENSVQFLGTRDDIPSLLHGMDVFILPSHFEGLGIVLIEAQAAGLHCLTSADFVTNEAKITNFLEYISLQKNPSVWAKKALEYNEEYERICTKKQIKDAGYDIEEQALLLQNYYEKKFEDL